MAKVQQGMETSKKGAVTMSDYMESKIRWLHHTLDEWVDGPGTPSPEGDEVTVKL